MVDLKKAEEMVLKRERMRDLFKALTGTEDSTSFELVSLIHLAAIEMEKASNQRFGSQRVSGPRWGILFRVFAEEKLGEQNGVTPTELSQLQGVGKNTMSSMLRGLEEQELILRTLDPVDHRHFRILLTPKGRELVIQTTQRRNLVTLQVASSLSHEERVQLVTLLDKLILSMKMKSKERCMVVDLGERQTAV